MLILKRADSPAFHRINYPSRLEWLIELPEHEIVRSARRRRISLEVRHDRRVILRLPSHISDEEGQRFLASRVDWVLRSQNEMLSREHGRLPVHMEQGGSMPWLGRDYTVELQPGIEPSVTDDGLMLLPAPANASPEMQQHCIRLGIDRLIDREAMPYIGARLRELSERTGLQGTTLVLKDYRSRWGSCSNTGTITLNRRLMLCRPDVVDYVIVHELCHLRHLNHGKRFWQLVEKHCPSWRRQRDWLKVNATLLEF
ncbi:M48 family metallopeptidase [bacterium]|nr:M48 family metallopeptidase [bacterium]